MMVRRLGFLALCTVTVWPLAGCGRDGQFGLGTNPTLDDGGFLFDGAVADGALVDTGLPPGDGGSPDVEPPPPPMDGSFPDTGFPPPPDGGVPDMGFPPPDDGGVPDMGFPPRPDTGFPPPPDSGVPDTGFPPRPDTGVPDTGFPPFPDGGFPDAFFPDTGFPPPPDGGFRDGGGRPDAFVPDSGVACPAGCAFLDDACNVGLCAPDGVTCVRVPRPPGTGCDDGDACTVGDRCRGGTCQSGRPRDCSAAGDDCNLGICDMATGGCVPLPLPDGLPCDDGDQCTSDACLAGVCMGTVTPPAGDVCADAIPVPELVGTQMQTGNTTCAADDGTGLCAPAGGGRDIIYQTTLTGTRRLLLETVPATTVVGFDTVLHARTTCTDAASELVCDDNSGVVSLSAIDQVFAPGDVFVFADGASATANGDYALQVQMDPQDTCANPSVLPMPALGQVIEVAGNTQGAANTFTAGCAFGANSPDHVWELVVPTQARLRLETVVPPFGRYDTALHVRTTTCAAGGNDVIACDDDLGQGTLSLIERTFAPGTYYVVVDGFSSNSQGEYRLAITQVPAFVSVFFPDTGDARQPLAGPFSAQGHFVEGIRTITPTSVSRLEVAVEVTNNLTCGTARFLVRVNNVDVGSFFVTAGTTNVGQTFTFGAISSPTGRYNLRYELQNNIPATCGSVDLPNGVSTVGLGN